MTGFYVRWGVILAAGALIAGLAYQHYRDQVQPMTPEELFQAGPAGTVRVIGLVQPGSLVIDPEAATSSSFRADFDLAGRVEHLPVRYAGPADDNLRELKTLIVVGQWNAEGRIFEAQDLALVPNYGYIAAAYLLALLPLGLFLFGMERRVALLYTVIKAATPYQPESDSVEQS
ncbi:MAG: cytochrome c maturation protein CcmE [Nitrospirota bacterium]